MADLNPLWDAEKQIRGLRRDLEFATALRVGFNECGALCKEAFAYHSFARWWARHPFLRWPYAPFAAWCFVQAKLHARRAYQLLTDYRVNNTESVSMVIDWCDVVATVLLRSPHSDPRKAWEVAYRGYRAAFSRLHMAEAGEAELNKMRVPLSLLCITLWEAAEKMRWPYDSGASGYSVSALLLAVNTARVYDPIGREEVAQMARLCRRVGDALGRGGHAGHPLLLKQWQASELCSLAHTLRDRGEELARQAGATSQL